MRVSVARPGREMTTASTCSCCIRPGKGTVDSEWPALFILGPISAADGTHGGTASHHRLQFVCLYLYAKMRACEPKLMTSSKNFVFFLFINIFCCSYSEFQKPVKGFGEKLCCGKGRSQRQLAKLSHYFFFFF